MTADTFTSTVDAAAAFERAASRVLADREVDRVVAEVEFPPCPDADGKHCMHVISGSDGDHGCCICDAEEPCTEARERNGRGEDACPECPEGTLETGPMEYDTGHVPYRCDAGCGYQG